MSDRRSFIDAVGEAIAAFPENRICRRLDEGRLEMADYHALLRMLFHQTWEGPATFALAGAHCDPRHERARAYLIHHADEEKLHYQWVINDLRATGDVGPDPRTTLPAPACQAYVAFNWFVATRAPIARLAIAAVLEGISARHGTTYGRRLCEALRLGREQASFFVSHGELDVGHVEEVLAVIDDCELEPREWDWMAHAARTAGVLYRRMYEEARP